MVKSILLCIRLPPYRNQPYICPQSMPNTDRMAGQQFTLLHQHIDELTEEKLGLQRGLAQQQKMAQDRRGRGERGADSTVQLTGPPC